MRVAEVMTPDVVTVTAEAPFKQVVATLVDRDISALPVVDEDGLAVGVVTEADLMGRATHGSRRRRALEVVAEHLAGRDPGWLHSSAALTAGELMSSPPVTVRPGEDVRVAARRMQERGVKRLLVVDDAGRLVGVVSRHDVLQMFAAPDEDVAEAVAARLVDVRWVPEDIDVRSDVHDGVVRLDGSVLHPSDRRVVEAAVASLAGVVAVDSRLSAREAEPVLPPY
ncbi:MAG TPA: CBS domain-containing protein [Acidimicrobiales bacterium]|nr:CBS domain-containing protein [Acidimicrobiales bacterium]